MVKAKYLGTEADRHDMEKLQLKQVLRRNFGQAAMFGFASTLICTWEIVLASLSISLLNGGTAGLFWSFIIVCFGFAAVYSSIAELGSVIPTSGGQYYWVSVIAPRRGHKFLSYVTGWLCTTAWQTGISSSAFLAGTIIQGLFVLNIPTYTFQNWHGTLLIIAIVTVAIVFNTLLAKRLPLIEGLLVILHILGVVLLVPVWILAPISEGGAVLTTFYDGGGWGSTGLSVMVGMLPVALSLLGLDCSVHMAEEIKDSSRTLPLSLLIGFFINAFLGFFVMMTCIYTIGPLTADVLAPATGYPFIDLFYRATGSLAATNAMTSIMVINLTASAIAVLATASRQLWAFARNGGLPFSRLLAPGDLPGDIPLAALVVSLCVTICLSLINIGSTAALNAIFSLNTGSLITSYMITIGCTILRRLRGHAFPPARFTLGRWGLPINIAAMCFLIPVFIFSFFPPGPSPTPQSMNYGAVMYGAVIIFSTAYYVVRGRFTYTPPDEDVKNAAVEQVDSFYVDGSDEQGFEEELHHAGEKED